MLVWHLLINFYIITSRFPLCTTKKPNRHNFHRPLISCIFMQFFIRSVQIFETTTEKVTQPNLTYRKIQQRESRTCYMERTRNCWFPDLDDNIYWLDKKVSFVMQNVASFAILVISVLPAYLLSCLRLMNWWTYIGLRPWTIYFTIRNALRLQRQLPSDLFIIL